MNTYGIEGIESFSIFERKAHGERRSFSSLTQGAIMVSMKSELFIWEQMKQPLTIHKLLANFVNEFDVDSVTAREDLINLLQDLLDEKLIVVSEI